MVNLSPILEQLTPYIPGEQPKDLDSYVKLNTNENPFSPSEKVKLLLENFNIDKLGLYPDPHLIELRKKIAWFYNVNLEDVFVGNGSDEILAFSFLISKIDS